MLAALLLNLTPYVVTTDTHDYVRLSDIQRMREREKNKVLRHDLVRVEAEELALQVRVAAGLIKPIDPIVAEIKELLDQKLGTIAKAATIEDHSEISMLLLLLAA